MPNKILVATNTTPIVWADLTDYAGDGGARTHAMDLTSLLGGAARQSRKADMDTGGVLNRFSKEFIITARVEMLNAPNPKDYVSIYWAASPSQTRDENNPGGVDGDDGAYTGTAGSTLDESLKKLQFIGDVMLTADGTGTVQQGTFRATLLLQYGMVIVVNNSVRDFIGDAVEMSITFTPREYEVQ